MTIPSHVKDMLQKVRARFQMAHLQDRMLPSDAEFTTLRPVRKATGGSVAKYWDRLLKTASPADRDALGRSPYNGESRTI